MPSPSSRSLITPSAPGIIGHFTFFAMSFPFALSPRARIASWEGPINFTSQLLHREANLAFSLRKPYPGWMLSAPVISHAVRRWGILRYEREAGLGPIQTASVA